METQARSIVKTVLWRTIATIITFAVAWVVTRDPAATLAVGGVDFVVKLTGYYAHERLWSRVRWGLVRPPESGSDEGQPLRPVESRS